MAELTRRQLIDVLPVVDLDKPGHPISALQHYGPECVLAVLYCDRHPTLGGAMLSLRDSFCCRRKQAETRDRGARLLLCSASASEHTQLPAITIRIVKPKTHVFRARSLRTNFVAGIFDVDFLFL